MQGEKQKKEKPLEPKTFVTRSCVDKEFFSGLLAKVTPSRVNN
jgi:hypothetical protein